MIMNLILDGTFQLCLSNKCLIFTFRITELYRFCTFHFYSILLRVSAVYFIHQQVRILVHKKINGGDTCICKDYYYFCEPELYM